MNPEQTREKAPLLTPTFYVRNVTRTMPTNKDASEMPIRNEQQNQTHSLIGQQLHSDSSDDVYVMPKPEKVDFNDVFYEPVTYFNEMQKEKRFSKLRSFYIQSFNTLQTIIFYTLYLVCGVPLEIVWAICFAILNFMCACACQPITKIYIMVVKMFSACVRPTVRLALDPVCEAFSRYNGNWNVAVKPDSDESIQPEIIKNEQV